MPSRTPSRREIAAIIGDPKKVGQELRRFRKTAKALSSDHPRLIDKFEKQWVALYEGEVKAHGDTFASLMEEVEKANLPRAQVVVRYIDRNQRTMIL